MARVTVQDCLENCPSRFELILVASERAHLIEMGAVEPLVPRDNDKPTVIALREIAAGYDIAHLTDDELQQERRQRDFEAKQDDSQADFLKDTSATDHIESTFPGFMEGGFSKDVAEGQVKKQYVLIDENEQHKPFHSPFDKIDSDKDND